MRGSGRARKSVSVSGTALGLVGEARDDRSKSRSNAGPELGAALWEITRLTVKLTSMNPHESESVSPRSRKRLATDLKVDSKSRGTRTKLSKFLAQWQIEWHRAL